jgi:hypothetical protein
MKTWKIVTIAALALVAVALVTTSAYAYMAPRTATPYGTTTGVTNGYGAYSGGMMGGRGMMGGYAYSAPAQITVPQTPGTTTALLTQYYGGMGCGGMRAYTGNAPAYPSTVTGTAINITTAVSTAQSYVASIGNPNLAVAQIEEYTQNFYVQVREKDTGFGAFELLINKFNGAISPEMGPNMMWNTKYGMMSGGMMGGYIYTGTPTATMPVNVTQAKANAQQYLNTALSGTSVGDITTFYGYYTIEVLSSGSTYGLLSVNGYTGQIWYHTWHGTFIQELTA